MITVFAVCTALGFGLIILGLVFDDVLDGVLDALPGDVDGGGLFSAPVVGTFLGATGIGGLVAASLSDDSIPISMLGAGLCGLGFGWLALRFSIAFVDMPTDPTPTAGDYQGTIGTIVTPVSRGRGEAMLRIAGSPVKVAALSDDDIPRGAEVVVVDVVSSSTVRVAPADFTRSPQPPVT